MPTRLTHGGFMFLPMGETGKGLLNSQGKSRERSKNTDTCWEISHSPKWTKQDVIRFYSGRDV